MGLQLQLDNIIAQLKAGLVKQAEQTIEAEETKKDPIVVSQNTDEQATPLDAQKIWQITKSFFSESVEKTKAALSDSVNITHGEQKIALFIEEQEKKRAYDFLRNKITRCKVFC